jgi:hypothetical protein
LEIRKLEARERQWRTRKRQLGGGWLRGQGRGGEDRGDHRVHNIDHFADCRFDYCGDGLHDGGLLDGGDQFLGPAQDSLGFRNRSGCGGDSDGFRSGFRDGVRGRRKVLDQRKSGIEQFVCGSGDRVGVRERIQFRRGSARGSGAEKQPSDRGQGSEEQGPHTGTRTNV